MRSILIGLMLAIPGILIVTMLLLRVQLKQFKDRVPQIRVASDVEQLRRLATVQMCGGLLSPLLWIPFAVWIYGKFIADVLTWSELLFLGVLPFFVVGAAAFALGGPAKDVQNISVADSSLQSARDHIVDVWLHKKLPRW